MGADIDGAEPRIIQSFADFGGGTVLEVGCGDGRLTGALVKLDARLVALDSDRERLKNAISQVGGAEFIQGIGESASFRDGCFDAIIFTYSLHHVDAPKALTEAGRLLSTHGQLLVVEPAIEGEIMRYFELFKDEAAELRRANVALASSGFETERREVFRSRWSFRDREELLDYYFKGAAERDAAVVGKIDGLLDKRIKDSPIILTDESWICSMRKRV